MWRRCQVSGGFAMNGGGKTVVHKNAARFPLQSSQALHFIIIYYLLPLQLAALPAVNLITLRRLLLPSFNHSNCNKVLSGCFTTTTYLYSLLFRQVVKCEIIWCVVWRGWGFDCWQHCCSLFATMNWFGIAESYRRLSWCDLFDEYLCITWRLC